MFGLGAIEVMGTIVVLLAVISIVGMRLAGSRSSTLVLQEFKVDRSPLGPSKKEVEIVGRLQGIVAFCLSTLGFSPITRFFIAGNELRCESSSLFGQRIQFIPLRSVSNVSAGIHKPFSALVFAGFLPVFGIYLRVTTGSWIALVTCLLIAAGLVALYVVSKKFFLEIHSQGGPSIGLLFKPNVIEGVPINVERALSIAAVIRDLVVESSENRSRYATRTSDFPENARATNWPPESIEEFPNPVYEPPPIPDQESEAKKMFAQARGFSQEGKTEMAVEILRKLIANYPDTSPAHQARRSLEKSGLAT